MRDTLPFVLSYTVSIDDLPAHRVRITLSFLHKGGDCTLIFPVWIPGSYLLREMARFVLQVQAPVPVIQSDKNRWLLPDLPAGEQEISWLVYAADWNLRGAYLGLEGFFANGTHLFPRIEGREGVGRLEVALGDWGVHVALPFNDGSYRFESWDDLLDAPILAGPSSIIDSTHFEATGRRHDIALWGEGIWQAQSMVEGLSAVTRYHAEVLGEPPYSHYLFQVLVGDKRYGGLEHANCCTLQVSRDTFLDEKGRYAFWSLAAHEHLHAWIVKRLRPSEMVPYDLEREQRSPGLWIAEGWTDYLCELTVRATGLTDLDLWLDDWMERLTRLDQVTGQDVESVADASRNAWTKLYRPHAALDRLTVSYYLKGSVIAWLLDLELRSRSEGQAHLFGMVKRLWERFPLSEGGLPAGEVPRQVEEWLHELGCPGGSDLGEELRAWVEEPGRLPVERGLALLGLERVLPPGAGACLGLEVAPGTLRVSRLNPGSAAERAGMEPEDEIVAWNGARLDRPRLEKLLANSAEGQEVDLHVFRRGWLHKHRVALAPPRPGKASWKQVNDPSEAQRKLFQAWSSAPNTDEQETKP